MKKFGKILYNRIPIFRSIYHLIFFYYCFFRKPSKPSYIFIEPTNACNYNCIMCPRLTMKRKVGYMDFEFYKKIIDEVSKLKISSLGLYFYGEPLLHPKIIEMIEYAKKANLSIGFDTNALLFNEELSKKLINSNIDWLTISFDGFSPTEYKNIHGIDAFNEVIENVKSFYKIKKESGSKKPKIIIQTAIMNENFKNLHNVFSIFNGIADEFRITNCSYVLETMGQDCRLIKFNYKRKIPCSSLFNVLSVSWNGKVTVCCVDHDFKLEIGNVKEGIKNLFNSKKLSHYRRLHFIRKFEKMPLCINCLDRATHQNYIPYKLRCNIIEGNLRKKIKT